LVNFYLFYFETIAPSKKYLWFRAYVGTWRLEMAFRISKIRKRFFIIETVRLYYKVRIAKSLKKFVKGIIYSPLILSFLEFAFILVIELEYESLFVLTSFM
jgi:hypothetical protein